jgi:hypothetical protein
MAVQMAQQRSQQRQQPPKKGDKWAIKRFNI